MGQGSLLLLFSWEYPWRIRLKLWPRKLVQEHESGSLKHWIVLSGLLKKEIWEALTVFVRTLWVLWVVIQADIWGMEKGIYWLVYSWRLGFDLHSWSCQILGINDVFKTQFVTSQYCLPPKNLILEFSVHSVWNSPGKERLFDLHICLLP